MTPAAGFVGPSFRGVERWVVSRGPLLGFQTNCQPTSFLKRRCSAVIRPASQRRQRSTRRARGRRRQCILRDKFVSGSIAYFSCRATWTPSEAPTSATAMGVARMLLTTYIVRQVRRVESRRFPTRKDLWLVGIEPTTLSLVLLNRCALRSL